ncbi:MAG: hypothetical protein QOH81_948 [Sphingomonadales bacterium]|nr:hypothetical protein [Sphingomonadales bacterium]
MSRAQLPKPNETDMLPLVGAMRRERGVSFLFELLFDLLPWKVQGSLLGLAALLIGTIALAIWLTGG